MIIACPECNGKLSTSAPTCPHCGFAQKAAPLPGAPAGATPSGTPPGPSEIPPLSRQTLRDAARRQFIEWNHDSFWPMAFGMVVMLAILGVAAVIVWFVRSR